MKRTLKGSFPIIFVAAALIGCGSPVQSLPPRPIVTPAAVAHDPNKPWTTEEKIAAVQKSAMPPDQKKAEIDHLKAGGS